MKRRIRILRWLARNRREATGLVLAIVVIGVILLVTHQWWDELFDALQRLPAVALIGLAGVLPLGGVSIVLIHLVVGARFGAAAGLVIIAGVTAFHLVATHFIARRWLRQPVERFLRRRNYPVLKLGRENPTAFALVLVLVPGPPYAVRNYLLALSGVPLRTYFVIGWSVYVARSAVVILLGDWGQDPTRGELILLGAVYALKLGICALAVWHLRRRHRGLSSAMRATRT